MVSSHEFEIDIESLIAKVEPDYVRKVVLDSLNADLDDNSLAPAYKDASVQVSLAILAKVPRKVLH